MTMIRGFLAWVVRFIEGIPLISRRMIFVIYGIALIVGTHYPRLRLGSGIIFSPDKILHVAAFGGLVFLMMVSQWFCDTRTHHEKDLIFNTRNILWSGLVACMWGGVTEVTQQLFVPGRQANGWDVLCNVIGVGGAVGVGFMLGGWAGDEGISHEHEK